MRRVFSSSHREISLVRQHGVQRGRHMALGEDQTVAVRFVRVLRVDVHLTKIEIGQHVRRRERASRMAGFCAVGALDDPHADLAGGDCQLFFQVAVHGVESFLSVALDILIKPYWVQICSRRQIKSATAPFSHESTIKSTSFCRSGSPLLGTAEKSASSSIGLSFSRSPMAAVLVRPSACWIILMPRPLLMPCGTSSR